MTGITAGLIGFLMNGLQFRQRLATVVQALVLVPLAVFPEGQSPPRTGIRRILLLAPAGQRPHLHPAALRVAGRRADGPDGIGKQTGVTAWAVGSSTPAAANSVPRSTLAGSVTWGSRPQLPAPGENWGDPLSNEANWEGWAAPVPAIHRPE